VKLRDHDVRPVAAQAVADARLDQLADAALGPPVAVLHRAGELDAVNAGRKASARRCPARPGGDPDGNDPVALGEGGEQFEREALRSADRGHQMLGGEEDLEPASGHGTSLPIAHRTPPVASV
jgi:hypothetical protein